MKKITALALAILMLLLALCSCALSKPADEISLTLKPADETVATTVVTQAPTETTTTSTTAGETVVTTTAAQAETTASTSETVVVPVTTQAETTTAEETAATTAVTQTSAETTTTSTTADQPIVPPIVTQPDGDLMIDYVAQAVSGRMTDDKFVSTVIRFSDELFKRSTSDKKTNSLISPLSIFVALAMTANGAQNETKAEFEQVFGLTVDEANEYLYTYVKSLYSDDNTKLELANSIWFDSNEYNIHVNEDFLQTNKNYYDAQAYKKDFSTPQIVDDINAWVKEHTDDMIEKIIKEFDPNCVMVLINALVFDSAWETKYEDKDCTFETFYAYDGTKSAVKLMKSTEQYISGKGYTGFTKKYANGYKFVAVLPDEKTDIFDFVSQISYGDVYNSMMQNVNFDEAIAYLPAFEYDYDIELNDALIAMGLSEAFSETMADFSGIDSRNNLYIDKVLHNTHIEVKQEGTKAAAATAVIIDRKSAPATPTVRLDRPFVYYIIDETTNLPVFMGIVTEVK